LRAGVLGCSSTSAADLRAGDLVFHRSTSDQAAVIAEVTSSELTHVGLVLPHDGELAVLEAVQPVKWTPIDAWIARGEGARFEVRRPREPLTADDVEALVREGERHLGRPYDARFEWGPRRIYCSELVWLVYARALDRELVEPQTFGDLVLSNAARRLARRRLGRLPRTSERIVTPVALAESAALFEP
jgi:cell wall-associated NlpC family hydrolase